MRRITHFYQNGFATRVDGRCYLVKKVPGGYANRDVEGVDGVVGWFPQNTCAESAIAMQASGWGLGAPDAPKEANGWIVSHVCSGGSVVRMRHDRYADEFVASVNPASGKWEAQVTDGSVQNCIPFGTTQPPSEPDPTPIVPYTAIDRNIDWKLSSAIVITIALTIYIAYLILKK